MNYLLLFFVCFTGIIITAQAQNPDTHNSWLHSYDAALKQAKAEHKPILMVFSGSDWCKPCILLSREVWSTEAFAYYAKDNLVLLELDFPRFKKNQLPAAQTKHNEQLAGVYNKEGEFPLVVLINEDGSVIGKTRYKAGGPEAYVKHLDELLHK
ncbi:thioredoxin family protein [Pontibacter sp. H249]|uniref:thioredoxin family protein n=1 Tax=Pontibacter sp. H249 TaxID=3133420 RepID=UPI004040A0AA